MNNHDTSSGSLKLIATAARPAHDSPGRGKRPNRGKREEFGSAGGVLLPVPLHIGDHTDERLRHVRVGTVKVVHNDGLDPQNEYPP